MSSQALTRLLGAGIVVALIAAVLAFTQQQQAASDMRLAQNAQATAVSTAGTAVAAANSAATAQKQAEDAQVTAEANANTAATAQKNAENAQATAEANANAAATAQKQAQDAQATANANANAAATAQKNAENAAATANAGQKDAQNAQATAVAGQTNAQNAQATAVANANDAATKQAEAQTAAQNNEATAVAAQNQAVSAMATVAALQIDSNDMQATLTALSAQATSDAQNRGQVGVVPTNTPRANNPVVIATVTPQGGGGQSNNDLTEQFVSKDGSLSFNYPSGWGVQESSNGSIVLNDPSKAFVVLVLPVPAGQLPANTRPPAIASGVAPTFATNLKLTGMTFGQPTTTTVNGHAAGIVEGSNTQVDMVVVAIDMGGGKYMILLGLVNKGLLSRYEPTLLDIAATIQY